MDYLHRVNHVYYCRIVIPTDLKSYFPTREIKRTLRTSSKTEARKILPSVLADIQQQFHNLRWSNPYMNVKPPSKRAIEIYQKRNPGSNPLIVARKGEPSINNSGWVY